MTLSALKQSSVDAHPVILTNRGVARNSTLSLAEYGGCPQRDKESSVVWHFFSKLLSKLPPVHVQKWYKGSSENNIAHRAFYKV